MTNLITSPSFEGSLEDRHWYVHPSGCGLLPKGWVPCYTEEREEEWQNYRPEYGYPERHDPQWEYRRRTGEKSFGYGSDWHTHKGGALYIFEQLGLTGKRLRFSAWGYYLVGGTGVENPEHPGLVNDRIGIAASGEIDWMNDSITWSVPFENVVRGYNTKPTWRQHIIEATATTDRIVLFLYTNPTWAGIRTSGPNWDDVSLEIMEDSHCYGLPRIDYPRVVNVTPNKAKAREILEKTWPQTISNSYDDAGVSSLSNKLAVLWDIPLAEQSEYASFYSTYYPGTVVEFKYTDDWEEPSGPTGWDQYLLWQADPEWADIQFGPGNCMMRNDACYITALASAQRIYGIDTEATPLTVDAALGIDGYANPCNALWSKVAERLGMAISSSTKTQADAHIRNGGVMLIEVLPNELQHFVLAIEVLGNNNYLVLDPFKNIVTPLLDLYLGWESWRMLTKMGIPEPPGPTPEPGPQLPKMDTLVSLHLQTGVEGDDEYVRQMGHGVVKTFSFEHAAHLETVNPNVITIVRQYTGEQHIGPDPAKSAADYIATFYDSLMRFQPHYIEGWNETIGSSDLESLKWFVEFEKHFAYQIAGLGIRTRACGLNIAVGNPLEEWVSHLTPAVRALYETGGIIGYHNYWWGNPNVDVLHEMRSWWPWHAGRALEGWDPVFRAQGIYPTYVFTESGIVGSPDGYSLNAHAGWKSSNTLKGNWEQYYQQNALLKSLMEEWNALHGNRSWCALLFTSGIGTGWSNFQIRKPEIESLTTL